MTVINPQKHSSNTAQCARCGITRRVNSGRNGRVCRDCSSVLNPTEKKRWNA